MPAAWRVHVIEERLRECGLDAEVRERDIYSAPPAEREEILAAVVKEKAAFPMVLVNGRIACHSGIDLDRIEGAAREVPRGVSCC